MAAYQTPAIAVAETHSDQARPPYEINIGRGILPNRVRIALRVLAEFRSRDPLRIARVFILYGPQCSKVVLQQAVLAVRHL